jgi:GTPase-associated protein 1, N-terminal domain type 2/GTPase-associated protein 1, C-terminal domain/GTPase-associated protein 1, middle domain
VDPGLRQLYYTSCATGLRGFDGYQFNAVTPGTAPETERDVLALATYEPPRTLIYSDDPGQLALCPVNLAYQPEPGAVLANTVYVGRDTSRRFGNFFIHALAADSAADLGRRLGPLLPIELWRSPLWRREPIASTELPGLDRPPPAGPLRPAGVHEFVESHPGRGELAALVTAAARAATEDGLPVLVVDADSDRVAQWFAAVCFLLPPSLAASISFATYVSRPSRSRTHLRGTVPEAGQDLGADAEEMFVLFDFAADRFSRLPAHPLAVLLARIGPPSARALWRGSAMLASGTERSLDDWYPIGAAAAALGGMRLAPAEFEAAVAWSAAAAGRLAPAVLSELGRALYGQPERAERHLATLVEVTGRGEDAVLCDEIRFAQIDAELIAVAAGERAAGQARVATEPVRLRVAERLDKLLISAEPAGGLNLLEWAGREGIGLGTVTLRAFGSARLAPAWAGQPGGSAGAAAAALEQWPDVRAGLVDQLRELAERQSPRGPGEVARALDAALDGPIGQVLHRRDVSDQPALHEALVLSRGRRAPAERVRALIEALQVRRTLLPDADLVLRLWPSGAWSPADVQKIAQAVPVEELDDDLLAAMAARALANADDSRVLDWFLPLAARLVQAPAVRRLDPLTALLLTDPLDFARLAGAPSTIADFAELLRGLSSQRHPVVRRIARGRVPQAMARLPLPSYLLINCLETRLDDGMFASYIRIMTNTAQEPRTEEWYANTVALFVARLAGERDNARWAALWARTGPLPNDGWDKLLGRMKREYRYYYDGLVRYRAETHPQSLIGAPIRLVRRLLSGQPEESGPQGRQAPQAAAPTSPQQAPGGPAPKQLTAGPEPGRAAPPAPPPAGGPAGPGPAAPNRPKS